MFRSSFIKNAQHEFFKPLLLAVGKELNTTATWHKLALSVGVSLASMIDVASDVYTISYYHRIGKHATANLMTAFVLLCIFLQMMLVVAIHHKNRRRMVLELLGTITFTKPAFNKFRVLTNASIDGHEVSE